MSISTFYTALPLVYRRIKSHCAPADDFNAGHGKPHGVKNLEASGEQLANHREERPRPSSTTSRNRWLYALAATTIITVPHGHTTGTYTQDIYSQTCCSHDWDVLYFTDLQGNRSTRLLGM